MIKLHKPVRGIFGSAFNSPAVMVLLLDRTLFEYKVITNNPVDTLKVLELKRWCRCVHRSKSGNDLEKVVIFTKMSLVRQWAKKLSFSRQKLVVFDALDRLLSAGVQVLDSDFNKQVNSYIRSPISQNRLNNSLLAAKTFNQKHFLERCRQESKEGVESGIKSVTSIPPFLHKDSLDYMMHKLEDYLTDEDFRSFSLSCFECISGLSRRSPFRRIKTRVSKNVDTAKARSLINAVSKLVDKQYKKIFIAMSILSTTKKTKKFAIKFSGCDPAVLSSVIMNVQPSSSLLFAYKIPVKVIKLSKPKKVVFSELSKKPLKVISMQRRRFTRNMSLKKVLAFFSYT